VTELVLALSITVALCYCTTLLNFSSLFLLHLICVEHRQRYYHCLFRYLEVTDLRHSCETNMKFKRKYSLCVCVRVYTNKNNVFVHCYDIKQRCYREINK